jgi:hypothetical protein
MECFGFVEFVMYIIMPPRLGYLGYSLVSVNNYNIKIIVTNMCFCRNKI